MSTFFKSENIKIFNQTTVVSEAVLATKIASSTETNSIVSGQQSDLNYINASGDIMDGALKIASYIEFNDNTQQSIAFSEAKDNILNYAYNNIQGIVNDGGLTIISNPLSIQNTIDISDNSLPISKIINLQDQLQNLVNADTSSNIILSQYDTSINLLQTNINDLYLTDISHNAKFGIVDQDLLTHTNQITSLQNKDISTSIILQTITDYNIPNIIIDVSQNKSAIDTILSNKADKTTVDLLTDKLVNLSFDDQTNTISIIDNLQLQSTTINDLSINSNLDINGSCRISNINYEITDQKFNFLSTIDEDYITTINDIKNDTLRLDTSVNLIISDISGLPLIKNTLTSYISETNTNIVDISNNIHLLQNSLQNNINNVSINQTDISGLKLKDDFIMGLISDSNNRILTAENNIALKQNQINSANKLNSNLIADGTVTNQMFQQLYNINTAQTIQSQLDGMTSTLNNLDALQDIDISSISNIYGSIEDINSSITSIDQFILDQGTFNSNLNTVQSSHNVDISSLKVFKTSQEASNIIYNNHFTQIDSSLNSLQTALSNLSNLDVLQDIDFNNISDLVESKASFEYVDTQLATKQNVINAENKLSGSNVLTSYQINNTNLNLNDALTNIKTNVQNLDDTRNLKINANNMLESAYVKVASSGENLVTRLESITQNFLSVNQNKQNNIAEINKVSYHYIETVSGNDLAEIFVDDYENKISGDYVKTNFDSLTVNDALYSISNAKQNNINSSNLLNANVVNTSGNVLLSTYIANNNGNINTINSNLLTKQATINNSNKLSATLVSTLVNNVTSTVESVLNDNYTTIQDLYTKTNQIEQLQDDVSSLQGLTTDLDTVIQANIPVLNDNYQSLLTSKQNKIDINNLVEGNFVVVGENLKLVDKLNDMDSIISNKQNTINSSNLLNANSVNTAGNILLSSYITNNNSSISNLQNNKSDISFVSVQLDLKQNNITTSNRLESSKISTYINATNNVLDNVLQGLTEINTTQSTNISDNANNIIAQTSRIDGALIRIATNEGNISLLQGADIAHESRMNLIDTAINTKQNIINTSNKISSDNISTSINSVASTLSTVLIDHETLIDALDTEKQNVITVNNKLPYTNIDFSGSTIKYADYASSINTKFSDLDGQISTLTGLQSGDFQSFININHDLDVLDTAILDLSGIKQDIITFSNKLDGNFVKYNNSLSIIQKIDSINSGAGSGPAIPSISYNANNLETTISDRTIIGTELKFPDNSIQSTGFTTSQNTDLTNCKTKLTDITYSSGVTTINNNLIANNIIGTTIDDIYNDIATKQDILNNTTSKLNYDCVDFSGSTIKYADYPSSINTKFSGINESILSLNENDSNQIIVNQGFSDAISTLTTSKQNVLSDSNKLNSAFLSCSGSGLMSDTKMEYLSSISGDIQNQLSLKADASAISNINNTSDLNKPISTATQTALDTKWNIPTNSTNLSYVDINSSLETALNSKQPTITDNSLTIARTSGLQSALDSKQATLLNASFLDATSSIQTQLNSKQATLSNASFLDATSSVQTQLNSKQPTITDNSLTIARTTGLQSALDSKQATLSNASFLDATSSIQTQLNERSTIVYTDAQLALKQDILSNASFLDATSSVQTQLNGKQATITDNSLSIARTNGLQNALNSKQPTLSNASFLDATSSVQTQLNGKANSAGPTLTGITTTEKISEKVTNTYTYGTNILNIDYTNNSIVYFNTLASSTNFAVYLTNVNPNSLTYTTFTMTLLIDCATYNAYGNTCRINDSSYTLIASGGLSSVSTTNANIIMQQISVLYLASGTIPSKVITSISPVF